MFTLSYTLLHSDLSFTQLLGALIIGIIIGIIIVLIIIKLTK